MVRGRGPVFTDRGALMLPAFCDHTITVVTPGVKLVHGNKIDDWTTATRRTIPGCWVEPKSTDENNHRRDVTRAGYDVLLPAEASPPSAADRVEHHLAAGPFRVEGEVMLVPSADGALDHFFMYIERWSNRA